MVFKHRELSELDEPFEFKMVDEVEDFDDEEKARSRSFTPFVFPL